MFKQYTNGTVSFAYDDEEFKHVENGRLSYIGKETDGSKIHVPEGVVDGMKMFEMSGLTSGANLPSSLKYMGNMYMGCREMTDPGKIPDGVVNMDNAYAYSGIKEAPYMPDSVTSADFAFEHCGELKRCGNFSKNMESATCMFSGCHALEELPEELPEPLEDMHGFACDCASLKKPPKTGPNVTDMGYAYSNCTKLETMPEIPKGAYSSHVISDCYTLEQNGISTTSLNAAFEKANTPEKSDRHMDRDAALSEITDGIQSEAEMEDGSDFIR